MADRCDRTDLLVEQCACPQHRGGRTVEEEAVAELAERRSRLLDSGRYFPAGYPGTCYECGERFEQGAAIRRKPVASGLVYVAECCAKEIDR